ncbi:MAG: hypothetical protein ACRELV_02485 [Longimicrobiales bacterium]
MCDATRKVLMTTTGWPVRALAGPTLLCALLGATGCVDSAASGASGQLGGQEVRAVPRTVVAVIDFSGSLTSHAVAEARGYLEKVVKDLGYGDRLVLLEMYRTGSQDSVGRFVRDMPEPVRAGAVTSYDRRELEAARRGVLNVLPIFFDPELVRTVPTTDLFTTMHIAAEHLRDAGDGRKELVVLSDMLQSTRHFEFEGARRMPAEGWVASQAQSNLLPSLEGACVVVIGADPTTPDGQRVRRFWAEYFRATGARLDAGDYRVRAPTDVLRC